MTNHISYAHGEILFQTQKHSYISWNMENSWVSVRNKGNIIPQRISNEIVAFCLTATKTIKSLVKILGLLPKSSDKQMCIDRFRYDGLIFDK